VKTIDLNDALRIYFAATPTGGVIPYGARERLVAHYGAKAAAVQLAIDAALHGLFDETEVRELDSLTTIAAFVENRARARRPDLHDDVCRAIGNYASYSYK